MIVGFTGLGSSSSGRAYYTWALRDTQDTHEDGPERRDKPRPHGAAQDAAARPAVQDTLEHMGENNNTQTKDARAV